MTPQLKRSLVAGFAALAATVLLASCGGAATGADGALRVGLVPNVSPEKVKAEYAPLGKYLEDRLGMPVELVVPTSYPAVVEAMANDRLDLALFGGLTYVQARERAKVTPLVTDVNPESGTTKYGSEIIVPADSPVRQVSDLKGKKFAFGSISSTSGSLYPAVMLRDAGIDYKDDVEAVYTGGHDATAAAVATGRVDAGGVEGRILRRLIDKGTVDGSKVRRLAVSAPIEGYPWVVRDGVETKIAEKIRAAFVGLEDQGLLRLLNAKGYRSVRPADYDAIERYADELDLISRGG